MKRCLASIGACAILAALSAPAGAAPSFNCRTASLAAEKVVCRNPSLHRVDRNIAALYWDVIARARKVSDAKAVRIVRNSQRAFLAERNSCGSDLTCVRLAYRAQGQTLRKFMRDLD